MADETIELMAAGADERAAIEAALQALLRLVREQSGAASAPATGQANAGAAVPVRGQGEDVDALLTDLANDLLAQLDTYGLGLSDVQLDGLLRTDDGYAGWGYLLGDAGGAPPPWPARLVGASVVERSAGELRLRLRLAAG